MRTVRIDIQVHVLRMTIKLGFWGTLGGYMVCSPVKRVFFVYCVIQGTVDRAPSLIFIQECVCACDYRKWERL